MISANGKMYDHASSFATNGFIDWRQRAKYSVGDLVYIYCTRPFKRVMYKCEVVRHSMSFVECIDDRKFWIDIDEYEKAKEGYYARLKLLDQVNTEQLSLDALKSHGLSAAPQGPIKIDAELHSYIDSYFDDFYTNGIFTDVAEDGSYHEGHVKSVKVDIYERSSIARGKCIEYHGLDCLICGLNFGKEYGELGEGFIHVHHLRPLHTIKRDYVVDYKNDLIPVCPNCRAMIHRIPDGENMNVAEIKSRLQKAKHTNGSLIRTDFEHSKNMGKKLSDQQNENRDAIPQSNAVKTIVVPDVKEGSSIMHKSFGKGTVIKVDSIQEHIDVLFSVGEKTFMIDAFDKGFLKVIK